MLLFSVALTTGTQFPNDRSDLLSAANTLRYAFRQVMGRCRVFLREIDRCFVMRQTRALYARADTIIRKFSFASLSTKLMLFRAFCSPIYGCQLWCSMFQYSVNKLRVAYNDAFRQLLREPRW